MALRIGVLAAVVVTVGAMAGAAPTPCTGNCTTVQLTSGTIEGHLRENVVHFLGVPYVRASVPPILILDSRQLSVTRIPRCLLHT
jgi:hypothetical protein